jgi:AGCS family alanine or glycine:cation symporter
MDYIMIFIDTIHIYISAVSNILWGYILVVLLLIAGIFFTVKTNFVQFKMLKHAFFLLKNSHENAEHHISSFQALSTSLASVVGVGSIAGMAVAISLGGPGTIFWVWVIALLGMATNMAEHTLGQIYKTKKDSLKMFMGGPSYYLTRGLKSKKLGTIFSLLIIVSFGIAFNSVQANTIGDSFFNAFKIEKNIVGLLIALLSAIVILGGIQRIAKVSSYLVPIMGIIYLVLAFTIIIMNAEKLPGIFVLIFKSAFGINEFATGSVASVFLQTAIVGIKRALFSTEAGMGSTPNISASAFVKHPAKQGILGMLGVFFVAFIICTSTALIILCNYDPSLQGVQGVKLVQDSIRANLGDMSVLVLTACIFIFGFTSIIGNYSYAENNIAFLTQKKIYIYLFRILVVATVYFGTVASLNFVWDLADLFMGFMIMLNLTALFGLYKIVVSALNDYGKQLKFTKEPVFSKSTIEALKNDKENIW